MKPFVLVTTSSFGLQEPAPLRRLEEKGLVVIMNPKKATLTEPEVLELLLKYRPVGMIAGVEPLTEKVIRSSQDFLKVISRCGAGLDNVDLKVAEACGIRVCSTPEAPGAAVAELAVGLIIGLLRNFGANYETVRTGEWKKRWAGW